MPCDKPMSWVEAVSCINENTLQSLAKLGRSADQLGVYRAAMDKIKQEYSSIPDYINITVFNHAFKVADDGRKIAVVCDKGPAEQQTRWRLNDFPYWFEEGIAHFLLWSVEPLSKQQVLTFAQKELPNQELAVFVNPVQLQSVQAVWHAHVLARSKPDPISQGALC